MSCFLRSFLTVSLLAVGLSGCGGGPTSAGNAESTPDGRPAGFEDMMKDMGDQMKKAGAHPEKLSPESSPAASKTAPK